MFGWVEENGFFYGYFKANDHLEIVLFMSMQKTMKKLIDKF
jgi:hypothetical protein